MQVSREGTCEAVDPLHPVREVRYATLSPDGSRVAITTYPKPPADYGDVWIKHLPQGAFSRLTFEGEVNMRPVWAPDGESLAFISDRGGHRAVWNARTDGTGDPRLLYEAPGVDVDEVAYSPDGAWLVVRRGMQDGEREIWAFRREAPEDLRPIVADRFDALSTGVFHPMPVGWPTSPTAAAKETSSCGLSRAQTANTRFRCRVETEPVLGAQRGGAVLPKIAEVRWSRWRLPRRVLTAAFQFRAGNVCCSIRCLTGATTFHAAFDVAADDASFLMVRKAESTEAEQQLVFVEHWFEELSRLVQPA